MRIGLDGFPLTSFRTGVGHYTFELARALALLAPSYQFELVAPIPFSGSVLEEIEHDCPGNLRAVNPRLTSIRRRRWWAIGLPFYIRQTSLDLFHGTNYEVPLWNKRRSVLTIHDLSILLHADKHQEHLVRRARRRLPVMVRSTSVIITPTESVKREICENFSVKSDMIVVTPEAPRRSFQPIPLEATAETRLRLGIEEDFILFVGTLEPRKNLLTLVRAFSQIVTHTSYCPQLVIAGPEGWLMDELNSFIKGSAVTDRLRLTGYLTDEELCALYSSCIVFVYPSVYEGFGLPPLEAMACGAPVIASRIPALQETLGNTACLVDPTNAEALARSIIKILEDKDRRRILSSLGREHAGRFSWERTARLTLDVYHKLLGKTEKRCETKSTSRSL